MLIFDLETTGLDPHSEALRCYGTLETETGMMTVRLGQGHAQEKRLLAEMITLIEQSETVAGWNISEFDLWFLHARANRHRLEFPIEPLGRLGKYGKPRFTLPGREVLDLAYGRSEEIAVALGCKHSLQPLAVALGRPQAVALSGADMPGAALAAVGAHCLDDIEAIAYVAEKL